MNKMIFLDNLRLDIYRLVNQKGSIVQGEPTTTRELVFKKTGISLRSSIPDQNILPWFDNKSERGEIGNLELRFSNGQKIRTMVTSPTIWNFAGSYQDYIAATKS